MGETYNACQTVRREGDDRLSRRMSFLLRHHPEKGPITLDDEGFTPVADLAQVLSGPRRQVTEEDVLRVAATDGKGRYQVKGDLIRAV